MISVPVSLTPVADRLDTLSGRTPRNAEHFTLGRYRSAGGRISVAASATGVLQLANPTGSDVVVTITNFTLAADMNGDIGFVLDATISGTPTTRTAWCPNRALETGAVTKAVARQGTAGFTGGTVLSAVHRAAANVQLSQDFTCVLLPNQSVAATFTNGSLGAAAFYASATWIEEPAI